MAGLTLASVWLRCASLGVLALLVALVGLLPLHAVAQGVTWEPWEVVGPTPTSITAGSFIYELAVCSGGALPDSGTCAVASFSRPPPSEEECSRLNLFDVADGPDDVCHYRTGTEGDPPADAAINWADPADVVQVVLWFVAFGLFVHGYATGARDV